MGTAAADRLSALDAAFLALEDANVHMHVGAVITFDAAPLTGDDGQLRFDVVRDAVAKALDATPRCRQKLAKIPMFEHPVWVDDERFNLDYHVRHTALPAPGDDRRLKRLAGRILSQRLDRGKPLWEVWVVEGVDQGRFALVTKAHHCMVDGIAGLDLLTAMLQFEPDDTPHEPEPWTPRTAPTGAQLFVDEVFHRSMAPMSALRTGLRALREPEATSELATQLRGVGEVLRAGLDRSPETPLNQNVGPFRRFDWVSTPIAEIKEIRNAFGGTLNDVVLATAAGAIGDFLADHDHPVDNESFTVQVPMNTRAKGDEHTAGNKIALLLAPLPVAEPDPVERLHRVSETTATVKQSNQQVGLDTISAFSDRVLPQLAVLLGKVTVHQRSFNVVITNVPGPQFPVYLRRSQMLEIFPLVPLAANQSLGIALFSYDGMVNWGLHACWDAVPDLHDLAEGIEHHFAELLARARAA